MRSKERNHLGEISGRITDKGGSHSPIRFAHIALHWAGTADGAADSYPPRFTRSDRDGRFGFAAVPVGTWRLSSPDFPAACKDFAQYGEQPVKVEAECVTEECIRVPINLQVSTHMVRNLCDPTVECNQISVGALARLRTEYNREVVGPHASIHAALPPGLQLVSRDEDTGEVTVRAQSEQRYRIPVFLNVGAAAERAGEGMAAGDDDYEVETESVLEAIAQPPQAISGDVNVTMRRAASEPTEDLPLWVVIRKSMEALSFNNYFRFMNHVLCGEPLPAGPLDFETKRFPEKKAAFEGLRSKRFLPYTDAEAYRILKTATEAFVVVNCGVALDAFPFDQSDLDYVTRRVGRTVDLNGLWSKYLVAVNGTESTTLPYLALIRSKLADVRIKNSLFDDADLPEECFGILREKLAAPCMLELIWSYWHEEGMLMQTVNAIMRRFQNVRGPREPDPLGNLEIDPLRPLNNLFWGLIQDEQHRLTVVRRNYEYDHHYGLRLEGRAVRDIRAADTRSKFLEAFHNLLNLCAAFFRQDDDTTVVADGFPMLNALKDVHLILSQGAHNQFGDLPSTARIEMLMQQWLLARPEFREFLPTRIMVAYPEPWMDRVDAMKKIQGWTDTSVLHFRNLGTFGEQILLSIRYGAWSDVNDPVQGANWARFWRPEIQGYTHAYRAVTGVDLTAANVGGAVDFTLPATLLQKRLAAQQRSA